MLMYDDIAAGLNETGVSHPVLKLKSLYVRWDFSGNNANMNL